MIRAMLLILALVLAAPAIGATKPPAPVTSGAAPATAKGLAVVPPPLAPGSSKAAPLYIAAECEHGCGYSEDRRSFLDTLWTDPVAAFTAVLAVSTIALWWVTQTMANTSKRALLELERPIVYGGVSTPGLKINGTALDRSRLEISIYNHGRTLARLRRIEWEVRLAPRGSIADPIDPSKIGGRELPVGTVCVTGDPFGESENLFAKFNYEQVAGIIAGTLSVWMVGFVRYDDIFDRHHISGFTQVFDPISERFVRRGGERYNYEREEWAKDIPAPSSNG